jgi:hypothetical protein
MAETTNRTAPQNLNSLEAQEYNEYLKGRATQGLLSASDKKWTENYNKNRYELLKGKATQGVKFTAAEQAESDFLINLGVRGFGNPSSKSITKSNEISDATRDAFAALADLFASYGLESLADEITSYMTSGKTAGEALIALKTNPNGAYAKRFAGNFARTKNGLNALSEAEYITNEKAYAETLKAYGLGNMLSVNREDNYKKFADYIAGDVSPDEFKDRVKTVVTRVQNADPSIKATLKSFYPEISDNDLVSYFLNPKENLPRLQEKVTASEIGAAFTGQGLSTNVTSATDLAKYGIDRAGALVGTQQIKEVLPVSEKLSSIYGEAGIKYDQTASESEFFKGNQDAAQQRKRLKSMERAAFSGSSGVGQSSLTKSIQGLL